MPVTLKGKWKPLPEGVYEIRDPFDGAIDPHCPMYPYWGISEECYKEQVHNQQVSNPTPYRIEEKEGLAFYTHNGWAFPEYWLHPVGQEMAA